MTPFAFDTLSASKRLREAGMEEGVAEAVVSVFQHAAEPIDISHLATKDDVNALRGDVDALRVSTKEDLEALRSATKEGLEALRSATKEDMEALRSATKEDLEALRSGTKEDFETLRSGTKADFGLLRAEIDGIRADMATKTDLAVLKNELSANAKVAIADLRADVNDKLRQQVWTILGGMAVLFAITTGAGRLLG